MKRIILGKKGAGKTMLIIKEIIPTLEKYLVFDFFNEYSRFIKNETKIQNIESFKKDTIKKTIEIIQKTNNDTTLIIDNTSVLFKYDENGNNPYSWLIYELKDKDYILVFESIRATELEVCNEFDEIFLYPTSDVDMLREKYIYYQGEKIIFKEHYLLSQK